MVRTPLTLEYALLGFLRPRPMYGYELHHLLSQPTGLGIIWQVKQSHLYALLDKLEDDGYLTASLEPQQSRRPSRKFFQLTPVGEEALLEWLKKPVSQARSIRQEFLAKMYFARLEDTQLFHSLVHSQIQVCQAWVESFEGQEREVDSRNEFDAWVIKYRLQQVRGIYAWLVEVENSFAVE